LAEIQLSFGELSQAETTAQKAITLEPDLSRTQTVLGFTYLTQVKVDDAMAAFEKAIQADQADPLPRLGLGLARIRKGNLQKGRSEIEVAASLDPNNSLIRSYLGKAYYEEKRTGLDEREFQTAKELDPNDPTPWFYDAIAKQTTNRPVKALRNLNKAIELNDNRAVYRSKLQLDSDLAARSAATARVYSDLGFQQLALAEGYKSVNNDPSNYSAHRFLADSYATRSRHEIARVSELLQSQLLQPTNMTPIQPRLSQSNLYLISALGPAGMGFNEFNPIFNRNRVAFQGSGLAGENETYAGEGIVSGIYEKFSFSAGYSAFDTDGWRSNEDAYQKDKIGNVFAQYELSYKTSIQAEYAYRNAERGDVQQKYFIDNVLSNYTNESEFNTYRLGARHDFSNNSKALFSLIYKELEDSENFDGPPFTPFTSIGIDYQGDGLIGELQYLYSSEFINITLGGGYADISNSELVQRFETVFPPPLNKIEETFDSDIRHYNGYVYSYINPLRNLTFTLGLSYDNVEGDSQQIVPDEEKEQFNPKIGITWSPFDRSTVRAAAFRVLKRTLLTDQTVEPTQVAGFNQFFDDGNTTDIWNYGVGADQKFTEDVFGGVEFAYRDMAIPVIDSRDPTTIESKELEGNEYNGRAYLFWTPHEWLSLSAEYQYEHFEREIPLQFEADDVKTHRIPLGIRFFHPSGFGAGMSTTYHHQDAKFTNLTTGADESENGDFWTVDAAINYRIPKRHGFITVGATNLLDEEFDYFEWDYKNPRVQPNRTIFCQATIVFP
jgi:Flp pilus assembly protein TadD/opacity protein-like surface antigen